MKKTLFTLALAASILTTQAATAEDFTPYDKMPAGVYEVDYTIYSFVQRYKQVGGLPIVREVFSADIRSVSGYLLRNGLYELKRDSGEICKLRKTGAVWELLAG